MRLPTAFSCAALIAAIGITSAACEGSDSPPAASLVFRSELIEDGRLAVPRDEDDGTLLGIEGRDENGKTVSIDANEIECVSSDESIVRLKPLGAACIVTGLVDWFDHLPYEPDTDDDAGMEVETDAGMLLGPIYGIEPTVTVTARYLDTETSIQVSVITGVAGTWHVMAAGMTDEITLEQVGRALFIQGTNAPAGGVDGDRVTITRDGLTLTGRLSSRTNASGTVSGIPWEAAKEP